MADISAAILSGQSYRDIVGRFEGTSRSALGRHRPHIAESIARAKTPAATKLDKATLKQETAVAIKEAAHAETVLDRLMAYHRTIQEILTAAMGSNDHAGAVKAVSVGLRQLELQAKILGELKDHSGSGTGVTVNVVYVDANSTIRNEVNQLTNSLESVKNILPPEAGKSIIDV